MYKAERQEGAIGCGLSLLEVGRRENIEGFRTLVFW